MGKVLAAIAQTNPSMAMTHMLKLPDGEERRFLEDGDEVILRGWCEREGFARIGLGECTGVVVPALAG